MQKRGTFGYFTTKIREQLKLCWKLSTSVANALNN